MGHDVKLITPQYRKPFVKRQTNDANFPEQIAAMTVRIAQNDRRVKDRAGHADLARRLQTMPGAVPMKALVVEAFAPPMESLKCGQDFAAWLGLVPKQHSSGGETRHGHVSKAGQSDIRQLLIMGAMSRLSWMGREAISETSWLAGLLVD